jgi:hypothetical protein
VETSAYNLSNQEAESGASQGGEQQGYIFKPCSKGINKQRKNQQQYSTK